MDAVQMLMLFVLPSLGGAVLLAAFHYAANVRCGQCSVHKPPGSSWIYPFKPRGQVIAGRRDDGYADGWRDETRHHTIRTNHRDATGRHLGTSTSTTASTQTVPVRTVYFTEFYRCPDCGNRWSRNKATTHRR